LGTATGASCAAVNAILEPEGIMQFCLSPIATEVTPLIFWAQGPLSEYGNFMLPWLEDQGISRIGLVRTADATGDAMQGILDNIVEAAPDSLNLEQTGSETFDSGATDVQTQLSNLRDTNPELVVAGASGSNLLPIVQAMNSLAMDVPLLVAHGSVVHSVLELVQGQIVPGGMVAGLWWVNVPDDEIPDSVEYKDDIVAFKTAWEEAYGTPTGHSEGAAFDSANQVFDALRDGAVTGEEIAAFIEDREDFVGVLGPYTYGPDDHQGPTYPIGLLEFGDDGEFHVGFLAEP
ncbi:MAG: ABC transporter substrate-binding protein, partial [Steroidobacteraceae bacterium]